MPKLNLITNALVRLEGVRGAVPEPFGRPVADRSIWVLEIALPKVSVERQVNTILRTLSSHRRAILRYNRGSVRAVLFIEHGPLSSASTPLSVPRQLVRLLASLNLGLEIYETEE